MPRTYLERSTLTYFSVVEEIFPAGTLAVDHGLFRYYLAVWATPAAAVP
jgi:hypothetical protein